MRKVLNTNILISYLTQTAKISLYHILYTCLNEKHTKTFYMNTKYATISNFHKPPKWPLFLIWVREMWNFSAVTAKSSWPDLTHYLILLVLNNKKKTHLCRSNSFLNKKIFKIVNCLIQTIIIRTYHNYICTTSTPWR